VIGEDSYLGLLREGNIGPNSNRKYLVLPRPGTRVAGMGDVLVPGELKSVVTVLEGFNPRDLSSSKIRALLSQGKPVDETILSPAVREAAAEQGLYRGP
jgi:nicotinic acid mononucleotide adenylyltransferase